MTGYDIGERVLSAMYRRDFSGWIMDDRSHHTMGFRIDLEPYLALTADVSEWDPFRAPRFGLDADDGVSFVAGDLVPDGRTVDILSLVGRGCEVRIPVEPVQDARVIIGHGMEGNDISEGPAPVWFSETVGGTQPTFPIRCVDPEVEMALAYLALGDTDCDADVHGSHVFICGVMEDDPALPPVVSIDIWYGQVSAKVTGRIVRVTGGASVVSEDATVFVPVPDEVFEEAGSEVPGGLSTPQYMAENPPPSFDDVVEARRGEIEPIPGEADSDEPAH